MTPYAAECRRLGIKVLPPDVNDSVANFASVGPDIRFGLTAVRNVGANVVGGIIEAREEQGAFTDFADFLDKVPTQVCNKRVLDSLIKAGAFDSLGHGRRALASIAEEAVDQYIDIKRNAAIGQDSLFGAFEEEFDGLAVTVPQIAEWDKTQKLAFERDMLGLYVSDHPLGGLEHVLAANSDSSIGTLLDGDRPDGDVLRLCGLVTNVQRRMSKKGDTWATITLEDLEGSVDIAVFPAAYNLAAGVLTQDSLVVVKVRVRRNDDGMDLSASEVTRPAMGEGRPDQPLVVSISTSRCTLDTINAFKQVLGAHPGITEVHLRLSGPGTTKTMRLDQGLRVSTTSALFADLKELLGPGCLA